MKKNFLLITLTIPIIILQSCGWGSSKLSHNDSLNIANSFNKLSRNDSLNIANTFKDNISNTFKTETFDVEKIREILSLKENHGLYDTLRNLAFISSLQKLFPTSNLFASQTGVEITTADAETQIDSFISGITLLPAPQQAITTRSFSMDTKFLRDYFSQNDYTTMPNIKLCLAYSKAFVQGQSSTPGISLVILGFDNTGAYIGNTNGNFYNQIAACPTVCPQDGDASYDDLHVSPPPKPTTTTAPPKPGTRKPVKPTVRDHPRTLPGHK